MPRKQMYINGGVKYETWEAEKTLETILYFPYKFMLVLAKYLSILPPSHLLWIKQRVWITMAINGV